MKKIASLVMLVTSLSFANPRDSEAMDRAGQEKIASMVAAALVIALAEQGGHLIGLPPSAVKTVDLSAVLMGLGIAFKDPSLKDYALRAPIALLTTKATSLELAQTVIHKIPFGLGEALKAMKDDGKTLVAIAVYEAFSKPAYERFRDNTELGRSIVHGE